MFPFSFRFSFEFNSKIWQLSASEASQYLVAETRDDASQIIEYHLVDLKTSQIKPVNNIETDWWTTLINLAYPFIFFEKYQDPQDPLNKDLLVFDLANEKVVLHEHNFQLTGIQLDCLVGCEPGKPDNIRKLDWKMPVSEKVALNYPQFYSENSEGFQMISEYLNFKEIHFGCEYLEYEENIIICYFERLGTKFVRKLLVIAGDSEIYHEPIDVGLEGYASGGFFVYNNVLFFIQNSNQLHGIQL